jgi:hypothetical protein
VACIARCTMVQRGRPCFNTFLRSLLRCNVLYGVATCCAMQWREATVLDDRRLVPCVTLYGPGTTCHGYTLHATCHVVRRTGSLRGDGFDDRGVEMESTEEETDELDLHARCNVF